MPYYRKKKPMRRRVVPRRKPQPKLKNIERRVKKLEHQRELKYKDNFYTDAPSTAPIMSFNLISAGDDQDNRSGDRINARYLNLKIRLTHSNTTAAEQTRVIVFWDKSAFGAVPNILASTGSTNTSLLDDTAITNNLLAPRNNRTTDNYVILMDKLIVHNPDSSTVDRCIVIKRNFKLGGAVVQYKDSGGTITSVSARNLCLCMLGSAGTTIAAVTAARFWYTDS